MNQSMHPERRLTGIVIIALLWTVVSIYNIYQGFNTIIGGYGVLPHLSDPHLHKWFSSAVPIEIMLGFFVVAYGLLTLLVVYGLYTAKSWSYDFALALPIFIIVLNFASFVLYASAPPELGLGAAADAVIPFIIANILFLVCTWGYLMQLHVKQYLGKAPTPQSTPKPIPTTLSDSSVPLQPEPATAIKGKKFCRYCGEENKTDAVFCEKCGKKIG